MSRTQSDGLYKRVRDLEGLFTALAPLSIRAPERMTLAQAMFFLVAASADLEGKPTTLSGIKEQVGDVLGRSLHTTYKLLLDGNVRSEKSKARQGAGLNWLTAVPDSKDARHKILRLTPAGRSVIKDIIAVIDASKEGTAHG